MSEDLYPIEYEDPSHPINMIDVPEEEDDEQCSCKQSSIWGGASLVKKSCAKPA